LIHDTPFLKESIPWAGRGNSGTTSPWGLSPESKTGSRWLRLYAGPILEWITQTG